MQSRGNARALAEKHAARRRRNLVRCRRPVPRAWSTRMSRLNLAIDRSRAWASSAARCPSTVNGSSARERLPNIRGLRLVANSASSTWMAVVRGRSTNSLSDPAHPSSAIRGAVAADHGVDLDTEGTESHPMGGWHHRVARGTVSASRDQPNGSSTIQTTRSHVHRSPHRRATGEGPRIRASRSCDGRQTKRTCHSAEAGLGPADAAEAMSISAARTNAVCRARRNLWTREAR